MIRFFSLLACLFVCLSVFAQKIPLINSGEVIGRGVALYDSGKYEDAIREFLTVPKRDTNYVYMLTELALTYSANKEYDKALAVCDEILAKPTTYEANVLRTQAIATDKKGDFAKAVSLFQKAIDKRPFDYVLIYNLGITYYNNKEYDKAVDCFFKVLSINPFHSGSHLNLGRISIGRGRKTHAMLSFGMYLSVNNTDNDRLVLIDKFVSNQIPDENSLPASGPNACEKLDQIIRSKIAMDANFKTKVPIDAPVSKQYEMLFEQLGIINTKIDDRWVNFYLPIYTVIKEQNTIEPFLYNMLNSSSIESVKKWKKKNEKTLDTFYGIANTVIKKGREVITVPAKFGFSKPIQAWYDSNNSIDALGEKQNEKNEGRWVYFHDTYLMSAEGNYTKGEKTGTWKYYYNTGELKSIENYETGEVTVYYKEGPKNQHFYLKNDEIDGKVEIYYASGGLKDSLGYSLGKRNGSGQNRYPTGRKKMTYQYKNDLADGEFKTLYENGLLSNKNPYKEDELHGIYEEYFANGKKRMMGEYVNGKINGLWKYYFSNGQLEKEGSYKNGASIGEWVFYDKHGVISEKINFNDKGEWHGEVTNYNDGKVFNIRTFKNGTLTKMVYFDRNGKEVGKSGNSNGTFSAKTYYHSGQLSGEGNYKNGKVNGAWKYFYPEGSKLSEYTYVDGITQGEAVQYFRTGEKKYIFQYKDDQFHGYFYEFHTNGKVKHEGWYQDGMRQQQWKSYSIDGTLESDYYYMNDVLVNQADDYGTDGKKYSTTVYDIDGNILDIQNYNPNGSLATRSRVDKGKKVFETFYSTGKLQTKFEILEGDYTGMISKWFPDGGVYYGYPMLNGRKHGAYKYYGVNNKVEVEGQYLNGQEAGKWTGYTYLGKVDYAGKYVNGERDSIWTNYFINGKISSLIAYQDDDRHGIAQYYTPEGGLILEKLYETGNLVAYRTMGANNQFGDWVTFTPNASISIKYPNGVTALEEQYKNGLLDGPRKVYFSNGKLYSEFSYKNGENDGTYKIFHSNQQLYEKGEYKSGELHGVMETYDETGSIIKSETYLYGLRNGKSILYNKGKKVKELNFWAGTPE